MLRVFVDLLNYQNVRQLDLNTLDKPVKVKAEVLSKTDSVEFFFYNWKDYTLENHSNTDVFTYAIPESVQSLVHPAKTVKDDFVDFVKTNNMDGVRLLVFRHGIDAVNLFNGNKSVTITANAPPVDFYVYIDDQDDIKEKNEENNDFVYHYDDLKELKSSIKIESNIMYANGIVDFNVYKYSPTGNGMADLLRGIEKQWRYLVATYPLPSVLPKLDKKPFSINDVCQKMWSGGPIDTSNPVSVASCLKVLNSNLAKRKKSGEEVHAIFFIPEKINLGTDTSGGAPTGIFGRTLYESHAAFVSEQALFSPIVYYDGVYFTTAHEMGHQFGLGEQYDTWFGIGEDPLWNFLGGTSSYPYGLTALNGWDALNWVTTDYGPGNFGPFNPKVNAMPFNTRQGNGIFAGIYGGINHYSFMSANIGENTLDGDTTQTFDRWTDDRTMVRLKDRLLKNISIPDNTEEDQNVVVVSGFIFDHNNSVEFAPFFSSEGLASEQFDENTSQEFIIEILDSNNNSLIMHRFMPMLLVTQDVNYLFFSAGIAFPNESQTIVIKRNEQKIGQKIISTNSPSINSFNVTPVGNDYFILDWNVTDLDNDELFFSLEYTHNGVDLKPVALSQPLEENFFDFNATNYAGSNSGLLRFTVTDGVKAVSVDSQPFFVSNKSPLAAIFGPDTNSFFGLAESVLFEAIGIDEEDSQLPDSAFSWSSSLQGFLGAGQILDVNGLLAGKHVITLTVTDSEGLQANDSILIRVCPPKISNCPAS